MFYYIGKKAVRHADRLLEICRHYDFISVDIFDTALIRLTDEPAGVFKRMEKAAENLGIAGFKEKRIAAQNAAEGIYGVRTGLSQIYETFASMFSVKKEVLKELEKAEIDMEIRCTIANRAIIKLLHDCKKSGKTAVFISDMYLPSAVLKKMLGKQGITGYEEIFVSNEAGRSKADGSIFKAVHQKYKSRCKKFLHIGDMPRPDGLNPVKSGCFSSLLLPVCGQGAYEKIVHYRMKSGEGIEYQWGFQYLAPALFGFCVWLEKKIKENRIRQTLFFTREGAFLKAFYDIYDPADSIHGSVFYVSRRSIITALSDIDWEETCKYIRYTKSTVGEIQDLFCIDREKLMFHASSFGLQESDCISESCQAGEFLSSMKELCCSYSAKQRELLDTYIKEKRLSSAAAAVDIGWRGSMQYYLQELFQVLGQDTQLYGFYFGEYEADSITGKKQGYLCSHERKAYIDDAVNASFVLENVLMPDMGTVKRYMERDGRTVPVLSENMNDRKKIEEVQRGAMDAGRLMYRYKELLKETYFEPAAALMKSLDYPDYRLACSLGDIAWKDVETVRYVAKPDKLPVYLRRPGKMVRDIQQCGWNSAFCRRLLRLPLPYFDIYHAVKQQKEKHKGRKA